MYAIDVWRADNLGYTSTVETRKTGPRDRFRGRLSRMCVLKKYLYSIHCLLRVGHDSKTEDSQGRKVLLLMVNASVHRSSVCLFGKSIGMLVRSK